MYMCVCVCVCVCARARAASRRRVRAGGTRSDYEHAHYTATERYSNFARII
jgi:hypothetical protein